MYRIQKLNKILDKSRISGRCAHCASHGLVYKSRNFVTKQSVVLETIKLKVAQRLLAHPVEA